MTCQRCDSDRIMFVGGKCSDLCEYHYNGKEKYGGAPSDVGIGGGDYIEIEYCLQCGQIQGKFPVKDPDSNEEN